MHTVTLLIPLQKGRFVLFERPQRLARVPYCWDNIFAIVLLSWE